MPFAYFTSAAADRSGLARYTHLIRAKGDPERSPRPRGGRKDKAPHLTMRRAGPEAVRSWREAIAALLRDRTPRTFHRLCVEIGDIEGSIGFEEAPDEALWSLVGEGILEHTLQAPILFRLRTKRRRKWQGKNQLRLPFKAAK